MANVKAAIECVCVCVRVSINTTMANEWAEFESVADVNGKKMLRRLPKSLIETLIKLSHTPKLFSCVHTLYIVVVRMDSCLTN